MKLRSIVIGLGRAGLMTDYNVKQFIKSHTKAYYLHPKFDLMCGIEKKKRNRKLFNKKFNRPAYKNLNINLEYNPHIVSVCVPTDQHKYCIQNIIKKFKPKIILCEKPLSNSIKNAKDIITMCKKKRIKLFVNFTRITDPYFNKLKKKINKFKNFKGKVYYNNGFINNGSHYLNLMTFLFGNFKSYKKIRTINKMKKDINIDVTIKFKNAEIDFVYKKNPIKDFEFQNQNFYVKNYKKKYLNFNGKKNKRILNKYQFNVLNEINRYMNKKKTNLCDGVRAYNEQIILDKIIN